MRPFTLSQLKDTPAGRLPSNAHLFETTKIKPKPSTEKAWITRELKKWCGEKGYELKQEIMFHPTRKWRFDWVVENLKIAVEFEGIISEKSRHTTIKGYTGDTEKYSQAAILGWKVLRYTALNYKELINDLNKIA